MEKWKDIIDYENLYQISSYGRVKSLPRITYHCNGIRNHKEKILKPGKISKSTAYEFVVLCKNSITTNFRIHRLVAIHFVNNPKNFSEVNHINGNKSDNNFNNLEWCNHSQNMIHADENGLRIMPKGSKHHKSKLTEEIILEIRLKYIPRTYTQKQLALEYGVDRTTINKIILSKTWSHC